MRKITNKGMNNTILMG